MAELQTGPRYLCLRHHDSRRTCVACNVCPPAEIQISAGFTDDPQVSLGVAVKFFPASGGGVGKGASAEADGGRWRDRG